MPTDEKVDVSDRSLRIERWFETVAQAWEAAGDLDLQASVLRDRYDGAALHVTRAFQVPRLSRHP